MSVFRISNIMHVGRTGVMEAKIARANYQIFNANTEIEKPWDKTCREIMVWSVKILRLRKVWEMMIKYRLFPLKYILEI